MEGSPVRGQERVRIVRLNEFQDVQSFQAELVRLIETELKRSEVFFGDFDAESNALQLPSWVKSHLEKHPGLSKKLEQGEMVGITHAQENPVLRPAEAVRSSLVLIPMIADGTLQAALGLTTPLDGPQLSAEDIESVRQLANEAAPVVMRLREMERLRRENRELRTAAEQTTYAEGDRQQVVEERNSLDALLQMRSHLQANVAHELRTPLAAIRGYARMILDGRGGEINATQKEYLRIVTENTNRLINVVSWMSYVAELSAQHFRLSMFDLRPLWTECVEQNQQALDNKSLKIKEHIPDEPFMITGDRDKLAHVFNELILAAAKFSDQGGIIGAEFWHGREKEATVKITEKGAPIPPEVLSKIFERSYNTILKPAAPNADTNINLSGVYDIVGMHGGRVFVNSAPGQGATFLFTLPAVSVGGEEPTHEQAVNFSRRRP